MSWEVQRLVWDLNIESELKFTALAYANFAKADGKDVYPSVLTIAGMTGYHERSVQRYKSKLIDMGILIPDGRGQRGTNKFRFPIIAKSGDLFLVWQGVTHSHPSNEGDNPSGDIPSGDTQPPKPISKHLKKERTREEEDRTKGIDTLSLPSTLRSSHAGYSSSVESELAKRRNGYK